MTEAVEPAPVVRAAGIMFIAGGKVLLVQRSDVGDAAGLWAFPGGKIEAGETAAEAARRECREELGQCPEGELIEWTRRVKDGVDYTTFAQYLPAEFQPVLNDEHTGYAWVDVPGAARAAAEGRGQ